MRGRFSSSWWLALVAALALCAPVEAQRRGGPGPRAGRPPGGAMGRPGPGLTILDRLDRMSPEERRRVLENLPPERRRRIEEQLQRYERLSPEERQRLRQQYRLFRQFPPEQQEAARRLFSRFNQLPPERRPLIRQEAQRLRRMEEPERNNRMNSEAFRNRYTPQEQQLIQDLVKVTPRAPEPDPSNQPG